MQVKPVSPPNGSELLVLNKDGRTLYVTRPQVAAILASTGVRSKPGRSVLTTRTGSETYRAIQGGVLVEFSLADFTAYLAGTATPDPVPFGRGLDVYSGTERFVGRQGTGLIASDIMQTLYVRGLGGSLAGLGGDILDNPLPLPVQTPTPTPTPPPTTTLNALLLSSTSFLTGGVTSVGITGKTAGSSITATSADGTALSVSGSTLSGTFTAAGSPNITLVETLAGATNSGRQSVVGVSIATPAPTPTPSGVPMVFLDTDAEKDPDDGMAWGVTEGMRREGELNVGSVTVSSRIEKSPAGFRGLADYAGLNNVPVGAYKGSALSTNSQATWTPALAAMLGTNALGRALFPDAVSVLRKAINDYTGNNGIIFCIGPTTNATDLLKSGANHNGDGINLTGMQLVSAKIAKIVVMAGNWPTSTSNEYNVKFDVESQRYLAANSPVPVYYGGASHVGQTRCGPALTQDENLDPFRKAIVASSDTIDANGKRTGYDPATILYGIRTAASSLFNEVRGTASFYQVDGVGDGTNFVASSSGNHYYCTIENVAAINAEMDRLLAVAYDAPYALPAPTGLVASNIFGGEADIAYASLPGACGMEYQVGSEAWTAATPILNASGVINKVRVVIAPGSSIKLRGIRPGQVGAASASIVVGIAAPSEPVPTTFPGTLFTGSSAAAGLLYDIKPENCRAARDGTGEPAVVGGPVGRIMDMSGLGIHAVAVSDADRWTLQFDGTRYYVEGSPTLKGYELGAATDLNFAQVALASRVKQNGTAQYQTLIGKPQVTGSHSSPFYRWGIVPKSATGYAARVNGTEILATGAGDLQLVHTVSLDTASFTLRKDGTQLINGTDDPAITYPNNVKARIGSHGGGGEIYNGRLYRLVLANRPFTPEELTNVEAWVAA